MFDLATNLLLKGNTMSEQQYDNSNQVALWNPRNTERRKGYYTGGGPKADFNGQQIRDAALVVNDGNGGPKAPFATLWWATADDTPYRAAIFNNEGKLGGKVEGWWVNVYKNDGNGPPLRVKFKAMETAGAAPADKPVEESDIPF